MLLYNPYIVLSIVLASAIAELSKVMQRGLDELIVTAFAAERVQECMNVLLFHFEFNSQLIPSPLPSFIFLYTNKVQQVNFE